MQSMDEPPVRPATSESIYREQPAWLEPEEQTVKDLRVSEQAREISQERERGTTESRTYRGISEQVPFSSPPPASQAGQDLPARSGLPWSYPPHPEQYLGNNYPSGPVYQQPVPLFNSSYGPQLYPGQATPLAPAGQPGWPTSASPARRSGLRTGTLVALVILLALVFGTGLFAGWQFGRTATVSPDSSASVLQPGGNTTITVPQLTNNNADAVREAVVTKVQPGVVQITVVTSNQQALGSGVVIDRRGYIITNNHVVSGASAIRVTLSNSTVLPAQVVGTDPADDLAVLRIPPPPAGLTTVALGDSSQLRVGQEVLAIGSPLGNENTVTSGIVSALNRNISEGQSGPTLPDAIQTDAPINPGNSGGALVDLQGTLVGVPTLNAIDTEFNTPANGLGFAIPANRIRFIVRQIIANGRVSHTGRSILGVTVTSVTPNVAAQNQLSATSGALVITVLSGGPAASAGVKAGDVIVQVGEAPVHGINDLSAALLQRNPGDVVALRIARGSQQLTLQITLGELPAS
jgi:S1-C subfamily serine protease